MNMLRIEDEITNRILEAKSEGKNKAGRFQINSRKQTYKIKKEWGKVKHLT